MNKTTDITPDGGANHAGIILTGNKRRRSHDGLQSRSASGWIHDGQHPQLAGRIIVAISPGNRHEVRKLPEENHGEHGAGPKVQGRRGGRPSDPHRQSTRNRAHQRVPRTALLQRRVDPDVGRPSQPGDRRGPERTANRQDRQPQQQEQRSQPHASRGETRPAGRLRRRVRGIRASTSRSSH